ncbi:MAG: energy transducer TonB [Spirochaetaceae bacterium]|nr:energy transducer TonB [Spirochaetaceae bacterium]
MKKVDNDRLLRALLISILFHGLLFFGINLLDLFPEKDNPNQYGPVTVILEKPTYPIVKTDNLKDQIIEKEITKNEESIPKSSVIAKQDDVSVNPAVTEEPGYDAYADIGKTSDSVSEESSVKPGIDIKQDTVYVPAAGDSIEYEVPVKGDGGSVVPGSLSEEKSEIKNSIISSNDISNLENALTSDNNNHSVSSESGKTSYEYNDSPVDFDKEGINRKLISNPYPELPADLPADFPTEIIYTIRFSLNADGLIKVLKITPSSVYPTVDASIKTALRSWTFNQSEGTEELKGTITLIFKDK